MNITCSHTKVSIIKHTSQAKEHLTVQPPLRQKHHQYPERSTHPFTSPLNQIALPPWEPPKLCLQKPTVRAVWRPHESIVRASYSVPLKLAWRSGRWGLEVPPNRTHTQQKHDLVLFRGLSLVAFSLFASARFLYHYSANSKHRKKKHMKIATRVHVRIQTVPK